MAADWYVIDRDARPLAGPFTTERGAAGHIRRCFAASARRGVRTGPLFAADMSPGLNTPLVAAYYAGPADVPKAAWKAQKRGRLMIVRHPDGHMELSA